MYTSLYEPKPVVPEDTPDLPVVSKPPAAEFELRSSRLMLLAAHTAGNRHVVLRWPAAALKYTNRRAFSPIEIVDVQAAAGLLRDDMPTIIGSRKTVWPSMRAAMGDWAGRIIGL